MPSQRKTQYASGTTFQAVHWHKSTGIWTNRVTRTAPLIGQLNSHEDHLPQVANEPQHSESDLKNPDTVRWHDSLLTMVAPRYNRREFNLRPVGFSIDTSHATCPNDQRNVVVGDDIKVTVTGQE